MTRDRSLDIAVTGMAARFPGADDIDQWWSALQAGRVLTTRLDRSELLAAGVAPDLADDPAYVPVRGLLPDADRFEHELFRIAPRDAELMDPQARLMLETAWAALEDAGVGPLDARTTTGVYASASGSAYLRRMLGGGGLTPEALEQALRGTEPDYLATRIAYKLGLTGPALTVQTACSSSLVAVHMAVQALLNGDCDQAVVVAAGVDFPQAGHLYVPGGILSASGVCRPFDAGADGALAGSGVACVVLRPLADALDAGGARPHGVILGTAINNDGSDKAGYNAPSARGQEAVIRAALHSADIEASSLGYLEAHATGTRVGDPIEWSAATAALAGLGARPGQVAVGAVKANIGHLDAAAGLASLIKALMVVKEAVVPPVAGFSELNPLLETEGSPLRVPTEARPWAGPGPRRAGVSSFGIGGTNAHVVIEQAPETVAVPRAEERERLVVLSAATPAALDRSAARLSARLSQADADLADVAHTLAAGRTHLPWRLAVTGRTGAEVAARLAQSTDLVRGSRPAGGGGPVVFLLPGQGAQYPGMAVPLAASLPGFSQALETCLEAFEPEQAATLRRAVTDPAFPAAELEATELAQPALFAVEYAAATALTGLGLTPAALVGHSLGEITAACLAGVLDLPDAARLVSARGRAMQSCPPGAMLALNCGEDEAGKLMAEYGTALDLAAVNGPDACVVAGPVDTVEAFRSWLGGRITTRRLATGHAFHSALIEPAVPHLLEALSAVRLAPPKVPIAANVTGRLLPAGARIEAGMFAEQARGTVRFQEALASVAEAYPDAVAVEVGPGRALAALAESAGLKAVPLSAARAADMPADGPLTALAELWTLGRPVDPAELSTEGRLLHLPGHPFAGPRLLAPEALPATPAAAPCPQAPARTGTRPDGSDAVTGSVPVGAREAVAAAWAVHLGRSGLGEEADFFDLGGDSLSVTRVAAQVGRELGVDVPVRDLLAARTFGGHIRVVGDLLAGSVPVGAREAVAAAWAVHLGRSGLDEEADFFDLGGDSLSVTRVAAQVGRELGVDVPVRDLLAARTFGGHIRVVGDLLTGGAANQDDDYLSVNRALWDERVPIHTASAYYDVEGFKRGTNPLRGFELAEIGDVTGKRLAHLQCHIGLDTLAWARRGAQVTGLDFSAPAIEEARDLAAELGLPARFVIGDVYESARLLGAGSYDIVYTGVGALCWLPDMRRWAETVASLLVPGGTLYLAEFHPFADTLAEDGRTVTRDYFDSAPQHSEMRGTYADAQAVTSNTQAVAFQHGLGEVTSALIAAGLRIDLLNEHDSTVFQRFHSLEKQPDGAFRAAVGRPRVPLMYSLRATRI
ncbi:Acyl transferase domain-containing protein [Streptomyces sp. 1222.5]|uniref:type I polyketide synthase n=1 Tax=unclassified Streptomyces TaxID=2593676 RepID=UPI000895A4A3|nr:MULTISPECIES: type I polyketide synthase [unclassified Streptomyces]PKW00396.1 acyl transferase domain-containing protein [Streptomyces sp. 5112.2]SED86987.1 Acyl transferase domain-containing protein [Streptomyces sp. 1222.5]